MTERIKQIETITIFWNTIRDQYIGYIDLNLGNSTKKGIKISHEKCLKILNMEEIESWIV